MTSSKINLLGPTSPDEDVWDDTELIREYNKTVKNWRKKQNNGGKGEVSEEDVEGSAPPPGPWRTVSPTRKTENELNLDQLNKNALPKEVEVGTWVVGSPCRAIYTQDGEEYEAKIVGMGLYDPSTCVVRFIGYGNEESTTLADLKPSHGKKIRDQQRREALQYNQTLTFNNGGGVDIGDVTDCVSNISLTSSMVNNCGESLCRDLDETLLNSSFVPPRHHHQQRAPLQSSTPAKSQVLKSNLKVLETLNIPNNIPPPSTQTLDAVDGASAMPSATEATIASSSSDISSVDGDAAQQASNIDAGSNWENFNNSMPQLRFPVPPMPLSFANREGDFDFGRGQLPSLLMSWYMAGYQSGFFDAKQEFASQNRSHSSGSKKN